MFFSGTSKSYRMAKEDTMSVSSTLSRSTVDLDPNRALSVRVISFKVEEKTCFLIELQQAGLFEISGYDEQEFKAIVGSFCPNILFPYARESIASLIQKGGFPEFVLQPINFDALFMQAQAQEAAKAAEGETRQ